MSSPQPCPDCGHPNPAGAESCEACNFPLRGAPGDAPSPPAAAPAPSAETPAETPVETPVEIPRHPLRRPVRRAAPLQGQSISLWLFFGAVASAILIWTAIDASRQHTRNAAPVEGSSANQQKVAEAAQAALAEDSTNIEAHIAYGDVLFDTGNWGEAIIHYRAAVRRDSSRVPPLVDLGVCYYNLGDTPEAERTFQLALVRDPHQPVALFNLGIVNEQHSHFEAALQYYHRALESGPGDDAKNAIIAGIQRMQQKTGRKPGAIPEGAGGP